MNPCERKITRWQLRIRSVELGRRTLVMGIVNVTPDSFSDGGAFFRPENAVAHALTLLDEGADLLDLGAERARPGTIVSVDTYKAATARAALAAGAEIVNDVSGFLWDPAMAAVCAEAGCGVVLMHTRGRPDEWRAQPALAPSALLAVVRDGLQTNLETAAEANLAPECVVLDPGYGFGKGFEGNYALLARQADLLSLGRPLLAGLSRKSFLGRTLAPLYGGSDPPVEKREAASLAALVTAILQGSSIVRVHAVRPAVEAARIADAVLAARLDRNSPG